MHVHIQISWGFSHGSAVNNSPAVPESQETQVWSLDWKHPLEEGMETHYNILAWKISWPEEHKELDTTELLGVHLGISAHLRIPFKSSDLGYILFLWWAGISLLHSLTLTKMVLSTSVFFEEKTENTYFNMLMEMFCKSSLKLFLSLKIWRSFFLK